MMSYLVLIMGIFMMGVTVAVHAVGATKWFYFLLTWYDNWSAINRARELYLAITYTAVALLLLHFAEILLWAVFYMVLPDNAGLTDMREAIYFSMVTFTTVGYGDITLNEGFRLLSGLEAMVGITVFGLTTAMLFAIIQRIWKEARRPSSGK